MIVSHYHKFIFFAVPKTGTHSIRFALRPHLHKGDWEQVDLFINRKLPIKELAKKQHGHIAANEFRKYVSDQVWSDYFKFGFVRNPWDRFVSLFFFYNKNPDKNDKNISFAMHDYVEKIPNFNSVILIRNQSDFLCTDSGMLLVDYLGRYEQFDDSFEEICDIIGIPALDTEKVNQTTHKDYRSYYDKSLIQKVAKVYEKDIKIFNYSF